MSSSNFASLFNTLLNGGSAYNSLLGGTSGLPNIKSTSRNLPFQDVLFNSFQNREGVFSPVAKIAGSPDASYSNPFFEEGSGGGMRWSYDPNWMTGMPKPAPQYMAPWRPDAPPPPSGGGGHHGGGEVHGGPAQGPPIESTDNLTPPPMPPPLGPNGHWVWSTVGGNLNGHWVWVPTSPHL